MLVQLPLHLDTAAGPAQGRATCTTRWRRHYAGSEWVTRGAADGRTARSMPLALNDTNKMELRVYANEDYHHAVLIARLDNLGKGASGAAVQNLKLMLGL